MMKTRISMRLLALVTFLPMIMPVAAWAQEPGTRRFTLTSGLGNSMGWIGAQGEAYFVRDRLSLFGGLGYTPEIDGGDPTGITFAAGVRGYAGGAKHRGFLELSVTQVAIQSPIMLGGVVLDEGKRLYGPGLQVGYQYTAGSGFTVMASGGLGLAIGASDLTLRDDLLEVRRESEVQPLLSIGFGYTWR